MPFELTETQNNIVEAAKKISSKFDDNYWLDLDLKSEFPFEFYNEVAKSGWLGMCMPEELLVVLDNHTVTSLGMRAPTRTHNTDPFPPVV